MCSDGVSDYGSLYNEEYYRAHCGGIPYERSAHWREFFGGVAAEIIRSLKPRNVFDAGCAWGLLVEAFWDRGVEARGVDISTYAIANVRPDMRAYCRVGSLTDSLGGPYDLVTCIEVLEHMPQAEAGQALRNLCDAADCILFSSTPRDFEEETHFNVQPVIAWLHAFRELGFSPDITFDASFVCPHAFLVRRQAEPPSEETLALFNAKLQCQIDLVERRNELSKYIAASVLLEKTQRERDQLKSRTQELELAIQNWISHETELRRELVRLEEVRLAAETARVAAESVRAASEADKVHADADRRQALVRLTELELRNVEVEQLARNLNAEYASPAWQLILKYRNWVNRARRNVLVRKVFEPSLLAILRGVGVRGPAAAEPAAPREPVGAPAAVEPAPIDPGYQQYIRENEPDHLDWVVQARISARFAYRPKVSIITPVYKVPLEVIRETVASVMQQSYHNWELCLVHADAGAPDVARYLESLANEDPRIKFRALAKNGGISENSNVALTLATGEFIALLDHDDTLAPFALFEVIKALNDDPAADFIYSDKDNLCGNADAWQRLQPLFKPQWSPEVLFSANYLTHLSVLRTELVREIGGWRKETDGAQDWDLFLRFIAKAQSVRHIPKVLYHWRQIRTSVAARGFDAKPFAARAQAVTLRDYCQSQGWTVEVQEPHTGKDVRVIWKADPARSVSVVFLPATSGKDILARAGALLETAGDAQIEILIPTSEALSPEQPRIQPVQVSAQSTLTERLAEAVQRASGEILVFVDEFVVPAGPGWLAELIGPLAIPGVGIVGAKLLDPRAQTIRHAGIVFDRDGKPQNIYSGEPEHYYGMFGGPGWFRNWSAVCGACFAVRREVWTRLWEQPRDIEHYRLDIELCLRMQFQLGLRIVYNPYARMFQSQASVWETALIPDSEEQGARYIQSCFPAGDPYFNPNLQLIAGGVQFRGQTQETTRLDYHAESQILVTAFDFTREDVERSRHLTAGSDAQPLQRLTWFLPEFSHPFYGGVHTILRFAEHFAEKHGVHSTFAILGNVNTYAIRERISTAFPQLANAAEVRAVRYEEAVHDLPPCDAAIATLWTTAYPLLKFSRTSRKFYFIQDYESLFYPAGSTSALVEATYDFGFTGICNTISLKDMYVARGGRAEYFDPCIDSSVFYPRSRDARDQKPSLLFCYARPGHPRNSFELIMATLKMVKRRLGDDVLIIAAGADWNPGAYGLTGVIRNLGLLGYRSTGALYRACDAGVVAMMTRHPSYLPLEMMACGCAVVTNRNPSTAWLLKQGENCVLPEPSASSMAEAIEEVLKNSTLRTRLTAAAAELVAGKYSDWSTEAEKIFDFMSRECERTS
jgi:O-antigen biosynthesis protein